MKTIRSWDPVPTWKAAGGIKSSVSIWLVMCNIFVITLVPHYCFFWHVSSLESLEPIATKLWFADHWWSRSL